MVWSFPDSVSDGPLQEESGLFIVTSLMPKILQGLMN